MSVDCSVNFLYSQKLTHLEKIMARKIYDVVATTGKYVDANGVEKNRHMNCGAVFENDKGMFMKLEGIPIGEFNGFFSFYPPRDGNQPQRSSNQARQSRSNENEDVPF